MTDHPNFKFGMWVGPQFQHLFHGTSYPVEGNHIVSGNEIGHSGWGDTGEMYDEPSEQHAWATPHENVAWGYGMHSATQQDDWRSAQTDPAKRARVHELAIDTPMTEGKSMTMEHEGVQEFKAQSFRKTGVVHDIMPGRQGTFPTINWTQFHRNPETAFRGGNLATEADSVEDPNHPAHPALNESRGQDVPYMRPPMDSGQQTLPLGDIHTKEWDGKIVKKSVDAAADERVRRPMLAPYKMGEIAGKAMKRGEDPKKAILKSMPATYGVTPENDMPDHLKRFTGGYR